MTNNQRIEEKTANNWSVEAKTNGNKWYRSK